MVDPQKDEAQYRHPWRIEEEESLTVDPNIQRETIISHIANILRKSKKKDRQTQESGEE